MKPFDLSLRIAVLGLGALVPGVAAAHDYWLELSSFSPQPGERVSVSHRVGERLLGEPVPRNPFAIVRFESVDGSGATPPVTGVDGADPAGWFVMPSTGPVELVYQSRSSFVELAPDRFLAYLRSEGLAPIVTQRETLGEGGQVAREAFSRSAKAWLCSRTRQLVQEKRPGAHGLELEIVPNRDLCAVRPGDEVGFRLLRGGRPAANVLMRALDRSSTQEPLEARTDAQGHFRFRLPRPGFWLIKGVQMERLEGDSKADWQSRWASLTFELASAAR